MNTAGEVLKKTKLDEDNMRQAERRIDDISISSRTSRLDNHSIADRVGESP